MGQIPRQARALDNLEEMVFHLDENEAIRWANQKAKTYCQDGKSKIVGEKSYHKWTHHIHCLECSAVKAKRSGQTETKTMEKPDGCTWQIRSISDRDEEGDIIGIVEIALDITEQRT